MSAKTTEKWVSAGVRLMGYKGDARHKLYNVWYQLEGGNLGPDHVFGGPNMRAGVGMVYEVDVTRGDGITASRGAYVSRYEHPAKCAEWEALEQAARVAERAASDERKAKNVDHFAEQLEPLARAYRAADPMGRQVIIARAIRTIMRGGQP